MDYKDLKIIFMGTPAFAVASLDKICDAGCNVVAVVTAPDKPAGRGMELRESEVKKFALQRNIPVLQPEKLKNPDFIHQLQELKADLQIVVAFRMLPEIVWNMPPLGTINVHGSLLPQYRGAAPINWAVINGEAETGVTTFKLQHEIDTGNILMQAKMPIEHNDTAGSVHDKMMYLGAELLLETVKGLADGVLKELPQEDIATHALKHAPKIFTETCKIDFSKTTTEVYNLIRGLSPYPAAFTTLNGKKLKVFSSIPEVLPHSNTPDEYETDGRTYLKFYCKDGWVSITELQLEGKKRMLTEEFLRGYRFN